jgi:hypothetical protein
VAAFGAKPGMASQLDGVMGQVETNLPAGVEVGRPSN